MTCTHALAHTHKNIRFVVAHVDDSELWLHKCSFSLFLMKRVSQTHTLVLRTHKHTPLWGHGHCPYAEKHQHVYTRMCVPAYRRTFTSKDTSAGLANVTRSLICHIICIFQDEKTHRRCCKIYHA